MPKTNAERQREYIARLKARADAAEAAVAEAAALRDEVAALRRKLSEMQRRLVAANERIESIEKHWLLRWFV